MAKTVDEASFRDPSGFVFLESGRIYRQINASYKDDYEHLMSSGLYDDLVGRYLLVNHKETKKTADDKSGYKVIEVEKIPFISYPYEWSFSQLKDAALLTLKIQMICMKYKMSLKDASAYNIQFLNGKPIFIDTLSFERADKVKPWVAYKQYCQHFLAPLSLMAKVDIGLIKLLASNIDGIPLEVASKLLPKRTRLSFGMLTHIHAHSRSQKKHASSAKTEAKERTISKNALEGIINNLYSVTKKLQWKPNSTEWGEYYTFTNYNDRSFGEKKKIINKYINSSKPKMVWDLGANNGLFSRIASDKGIETVALDIDPIAVEANYKKTKVLKEQHILPIAMDLTNPSPALGWAHKERKSLLERSGVDMVFSLALIHHLAISNNLPLEHIAGYFSKLGKRLVIEFVPKEDSQVKILLSTRDDIFPSYNIEGFEKAFKKYFKIVSKDKISKSERTLYLMESR